MCVIRAANEQEKPGAADMRVAAAGQFVLALSKVLGPDWAVCWDDCNADSRLFWLHLRYTLPMGSPLTRTKRTCGNTAGASVRKVAAAMEKELTLYKLSTVLESAPMAEYAKLDSRCVFSRYSGSTWVYVLSFFGG